jgi:hypothetical protein
MATIIFNNPDLEIECLYAFIAQSDEGEGVMAAQVVIGGTPTMLPLVGADLKRIKSLLPIAKQISQESGRPYRIYKFENKVDITEDFE